jgi:signal transduction histidine kinase
MKTDFMSMSVHLLRNPISILHGYLGALLQEETLAKLTPDEKDSITSAVTGADELQDLVENLLNLTQIEQNIYTLKRVSFDLENLVMKTVNDFKALASAKGIEITFIPSLYKIPMAVGDIGAVKTVLRNLIENAMKFTDQGKIDVSINLSGSNHQISIKDTGPGIPASNIPMMFTKFYRVKSALEMQTSYGLGLYISKKIIELHKGKIWVESVEGIGSTFHFTIPADTSVKSTPVA